ncbi:uncharacterized protein LOC128276627, partial [Anopheles cruzii]|uniref:uncharacterized protein LOC128276627 n=1 Tax=Anopheles cruzii TaxID=68878 RepID=UPI0022EC42ED
MSETKASGSASAEQQAAFGLTPVIRQPDARQRRVRSSTASTTSSVRDRRANLKIQMLEEQKNRQLERLKQEAEIEEKFVQEKYRVLEEQLGEEDDIVSSVSHAADRVASWVTHHNVESHREGDVTKEIRRMRTELEQPRPEIAEMREKALPTSVGVEASSWTLTKEQKAARQSLPKDLPDFSGDPAEWPTFISSFNFSTNACGFQNGENMIRLQRCLKGAAKEAVRGRLLLPSSVPSVIHVLQRRFGRPELLLDVLIDRVRKTPSPRADDLESLIEFGEVAQSLCEHVRSAGMVEHLKNPMLITELVEKLPCEYRMQWARRIRDGTSSLASFAHFMEDVTEDAISVTRIPRKTAERTTGSVRQQTHQTKEDGARHTPKTTNTKATYTSSKFSAPQQCAMCAEHHRTFQCDELAALPVQKRREVVTQKKLCWNCLSVGHQVKFCKSKHVCRVCSQKHHTLVHENKSIPEPTGTNASLSARVYASTVLLETVTVWVLDRYGNRHHARALLDSASMCNFMSKRLAAKLQLRWSKTNTQIVGIAESMHRVKYETHATIHSKVNSFYSTENFFIMEKPTSDLPSSVISTSSLKLPDVELADPTFYKPAPIDMIIGAEHYQQLFTGKRIHLEAGDPLLVETMFGWVVCGPLREALPTKSLACHVTTVGLENVLQRFWQLDAVPEQSYQPNTECEAHYNATVIREPSGRYAVRLPRTNDSTKQLGESKSIALRRFRTLERRLESDAIVKSSYHEFMREYERLGHMQKLDNPDINISHCFLPHHAVFKESSTTTKTRVVFDASCKTSSGYSLNDILLVGPVIQKDLLSLLLKFRTHAIALVGDIEKMYRQIRVQEVDQPLQRIVWRENQAEPISTYQLRTVTYGTSSAPYVATRTLQKLAQDMSHVSTTATNTIFKDLYLNNLYKRFNERNNALSITRGEIDPLTTKELQAAEHALCRMAQRESFREEHTDLLLGKYVSQSSRLKWLKPQLDAQGLIR